MFLKARGSYSLVRIPYRLFPRSENIKREETLNKGKRKVEKQPKKKPKNHKGSLAMPSEPQETFNLR